MSVRTDAPAPESRETGDLGWSIGVLLRAYQSALGPVLTEVPHGHRGYQVLSTVVHGDQPSQLALAAHLGIDRTVMTYLIDDLVGAGLVERQLNAADRRQRKVVATAQGEAALILLEARVTAAEDVALGALSAAERDVLRTLIARVACDVRDIDPDRDPCDAADEALKGDVTAQP